MTIRDAGPGDLDEILAMVRELAVYERESDAVVFDGWSIWRWPPLPSPA